MVCISDSNTYDMEYQSIAYMQKEYSLGLIQE